MKLMVTLSRETAKDLLEVGIAGLSEDAKDRIRGNGTRSREIIRAEIDKRIHS